MDRNIIAIDHQYASQEAAIAIACYSAAAYNGLANSQADKCDAGSLACPACPFAFSSQSAPSAASNWVQSVDHFKANNCTCPTGDGSLRWPCPSHTQKGGM